MIYEKARQANTDRRFNLDQEIRDTVRAHGVAGLFINPELTLDSLQSERYRTSKRQRAALQCTHLSDTSFATIAKSLAEGVGIRTTARIQNVNKKTVLRVLAKASEQALKVRRSLLSNLKVTECQLDEMWSFIGKKEKNLDPIQKMQSSLGDAWIWIAFDAVNKIVLAHIIGKRTTVNAISLLEEVKHITAQMPDLFSSDQLDQYINALLQVYGKWAYPQFKPGPGRRPNPRLVPPEDLHYVQVVKQYKDQKVVKVSRRVIFGNPEKIDQILSASIVSKKINTSYVERNNGIIRHMDSRCVRKTLRFSKCNQNHKRQLELSLAYYHLCRTHKTLKKRYGQPTTPFMAANLSDHVWSMEELLKFNPKIHCN